MGCELVLGQDLLMCPNTWGHILELDPQQEDEFGQRNDAVVALGTHDDLVPVLLAELAPPALPAHRLRPGFNGFRPQPRGRRQPEQEQGQHDVNPHGPRRVLGRMAQAPWLWACLDTAVLHETPLIVVIKGFQRLLHGGMRQEHGCAPRPKGLPLPLPHDHGVDRVGLAVTAMAVASRRGRAILIVARQAGHADDLRLQPFLPGSLALSMVDGVHPASDGASVAGGGQAPGVRGDGHVLLGRYHADEAVWVQPPQLGPRPQAAITDHLVQVGLARQIRPGLGEQGPPREPFRLLDLHHRHRQGHLGAGIDQDDRVPAVDRHLDRAHLARRVGELPWPGDLATALVRRRRLQSGAIHTPRHLSPQQPRLGQGPDHPVEQDLQRPPIQLDEVMRQGLRADRAGRARPLPLGRAPWAHPVPHLVGLEAHPAPARRIADQPLRQGMQALQAHQRLQSVPQDIWHHGHHLTRDALAPDVLQPVGDPPLPEDVKALLQQGSRVQGVHPVYQWLAVQAPRHAHLISARHWPTPPFRQVRRDRFPCLLHGPPPSREGFCSRGTWSTDQACPYIGISGLITGSLTSWKKFTASRARAWTSFLTASVGPTSGVPARLSVLAGGSWPLA